MKQKIVEKMEHYFGRDEKLSEEEKDVRHDNSVFRIDKARKNG